jgi:hypothetical protein
LINEFNTKILKKLNWFTSLKIYRSWEIVTRIKVFDMNKVFIKGKYYSDMPLTMDRLISVGKYHSN